MLALEQSRGADMSNHTGRLVLVPRDPRCAPDRNALTRALTAVGLLGPPLTPPQGRSSKADGDAYAVGQAFLQLVAFTGCAVQVAVAPESAADRPFCHIHIVGPAPETEVLIGRNTRPPRCPACRTPLRDWRETMGPRARAEKSLVCTACGSSSPIYAWDWKESGGCARLWLKLEEIFPGEAMPTDTLMQHLAEVTGNPWRHFYIQD